MENNNAGNDPNNRKKRFRNNIIICVAAALMSLGLILFLNTMLQNNTEKEITYTQFIEMLKKDEVKKVTFKSNMIYIEPKTEEKVSMFSVTYYTGYVSDSSLVQDMLNKYDVEFTAEIAKTGSGVLSFLLNYLLPIGGVWLLVIFFMRSATKGGGIMGVGKSNAKMYVEKKTGVTFADVAGEDEAKDSLTELVDFLKNPDKYKKIGAKLPKGALLVGPPGTGKTLLAKALAGEAGVPFFSLSGSDFVEMFVGVGASRVRDLFKQATSMAPCIIFIDEIDAIGKSRDGNYGGGNDEREQTLNQLLSEMDGFDSYKGIIILGATNRPEVLDKALLRPGRFDRRIIVEKPDLKGRVNILKVHSHDVLMDDTVDLEEIALATSGAVGADLANMVNEAAIMAVKDGRSVVNQKDLFEAVEVVIAGKEKKDRILGKEEKEIVAYHETGHALVATMQKNAEPVQKITIVPRTKGSLGYTMQVPEEEKYLMKKSELLTDITTFFGGRAAEEVVFGDVTTGASNDIERATAMARSMVTQYGMSDRFGLMGLESIQNRYLDGSAVMNCGEATESMVDEEVKKILDECYQKALDIIRENQPVLKVLADFLIEHETITGKQFVEIFEKETGIELKHDSESDKAGDQEEEKEEVKPQQDEKEQEE
ncbi:MAG: ATP-dependent zinc metalloprotease FtsH [Eubacterium sp.]|nr:ATP-dependent zinc metalloprotease FtsH [Eubacterium sp.]